MIDSVYRDRHLKQQTATSEFDDRHRAVYTVAGLTLDVEITREVLDALGLLDDLQDLCSSGRPRRSNIA